MWSARESAIAGDLPVDFTDEERPADRLMAARRKLGTVRPTTYRASASPEVCVRGDTWKMTFDMPELLVEGEQVKDPWRRSALRPRQRNAAPRAMTAIAGQFEHARPVDACRRWVGRQPALQLFDETLSVFRLPGQPVGPAEREPVLVPIQLPDDFVIATGGIQVSHPGVETGGWTTIVNRVVRPVGCATATEAKRVIAEQIVLPGHDPIGTGGGSLRCLRLAVQACGEGLVHPALMTNRGSTSTK